MPNLENIQNFYVTSETPESIHMPNQNNRQPVQSQHEVAILIPYSVHTYYFKTQEFTSIQEQHETADSSKNTWFQRWYYDSELKFLKNAKITTSKNLQNHLEPGIFWMRDFSCHMLFLYQSVFLW